MWSSLLEARNPGLSRHPRDSAHQSESTSGDLVNACAEPTSFGKSAQVVWRPWWGISPRAGRTLMLVMHVIQQDISTSRCGGLSTEVEAPRCRCSIRV